MLAHPGSFSGAELLAGLTPSRPTGMSDYSGTLSGPLWRLLRPLASPSGTATRAGKRLSHVAQCVALIATADPTPTAATRQPWARGSAFQSPLPARWSGGGLRPTGIFFCVSPSAPIAEKIPAAPGLAPHILAPPNSSPCGSGFVCRFQNAAPGLRPNMIFFHVSPSAPNVEKILSAPRLRPPSSTCS